VCRQVESGNCTVTCSLSEFSFLLSYSLSLSLSHEHNKKALVHNKHNKQYSMFKLLLKLLLLLPLLLLAVCLTGTLPSSVSVSVSAVVSSSVPVSVPASVPVSTLPAPNYHGCLSSTAQRLPYCNSQLPYEERVDDLVGRLSLEEKIGLISSVPDYATCPATTGVCVCVRVCM